MSELNPSSIPGGFAKSWRKEIHSDVWLMPPIFHRVWYWLRLNVQHEAYLFPTREKYGIWVLPGQRITSLRQIAEGVAWKEWGVEKIPNVKTIKAVLDWLETREMVTVQSNAKGTLITLTNWHTYNNYSTEEVTPKSNSERMTDGTRSGYKGERSRKKRSNKPSSPDALHLSGLLADLILTNNPANTQLRSEKREGSIARWAADIDKLIRLDGQSPEKVEFIIRWCQADSFWRGNILSGATLLKQWNKLVVRADVGNAASGNDDRYSMFEGASGWK